MKLEFLLNLNTILQYYQTFSTSNDKLFKVSVIYGIMMDKKPFKVMVLRCLEG